MTEAIAMLEVARDAVAEGQAAEMDTHARTALAVSLINAAARLLVVDGVHYTTVSLDGMHDAPFVSFQMWPDAVAAMRRVLEQCAGDSLLGHRLCGALVAAYSGTSKRPGAK